MSFLNDKEIRAQCLAPTHRIGRGDARTLLSKVGDTYYDVLSGKTLSLSDSALNRVKALGETDKVPPFEPMISPFEPGQIKTRPNPNDPEGMPEKIVSYGTSSVGYDVRLSRKFKIFTNLFNALIDPLDMPENAYVDYEGDYVIIPPNSYVLGHTIEYFKMPDDIMALCIGKSTYARVGCAINVTPIEPGFHGNVVIEIANQTPLPMKVYADMGIGQFVFARGNPCEVSYAARGGKYQGQTGIQTAIV